MKEFKEGEIPYSIFFMQDKHILSAIREIPHVISNAIHTLTHKFCSPPPKKLSFF